MKWLNLICDKVTVKSVKKVVIDRHKKKENERKPRSRVEFDYLELAGNGHLFTGAIPLLFDAGAFACCVSTLGRFAPL